MLMTLRVRTRRQSTEVTYQTLPCHLALSEDGIHSQRRQDVPKTQRKHQLAMLYNDSGPISSYVGMLGLQLVKLFGKDWRYGLVGGGVTGFEISKLTLFPVFVLSASYL